VNCAAAGAETYVLNFTTSKTALELAARENASSDRSIHELHNLVEKIALKDKIGEIGLRMIRTNCRAF